MPRSGHLTRHIAAGHLVNRGGDPNSQATGVFAIVRWPATEKHIIASFSGPSRDSLPRHSWHYLSGCGYNDLQRRTADQAAWSGSSISSGAPTELPTWSTVEAMQRGQTIFIQVARRAPGIGAIKGARADQRSCGVRQVSGGAGPVAGALSRLCWWPKTIPSLSPTRYSAI